LPTQTDSIQRGGQQRLRPSFNRTWTCSAACLSHEHRLLYVPRHVGHKLVNSFCSAASSPAIITLRSCKLHTLHTTPRQDQSEAGLRIAGAEASVGLVQILGRNINNQSLFRTSFWSSTISLVYFVGLQETFQFWTQRQLHSIGMQLESIVASSKPPLLYVGLSRYMRPLRHVRLLTTPGSIIMAGTQSLLRQGCTYAKVSQYINQPCDHANVVPTVRRGSIDPSR
jgi:hypothetical protein